MLLPSKKLVDSLNLLKAKFSVFLIVGSVPLCKFQTGNGHEKSITCK